ncbi:MAG: hypothetical protein CO002_03625 [Candidatus Portnoybacteria bacterium CG_4_8_14_3_um_filter_44_10]|uniref:PsbP C-terminal domain-containing protein n=5 Tax=Candidatus Portnoyibacteriota TaxID=1817913 RepID=A0A2H0KR72_9BACT|nr:MAG: hypothetical protein AUK17_00435 [Parcubacteria group bacterium CG2_30_44_18]PIQ74648.1 MAG: hypothetical protein COV85_00950 [Candidatus Portnoybacteria bacterium CG11_big_fil_rev_8_21_14_0_20_44_10]PIS16517.1 MAG: hypothetical protein COT61_03505 [Candidatus Portnoybacteria bacterium CG09_land_8_20_14_0_10_44_13]PIW75139.1 MAG: hypothetical protein CO002_03625 [Candidatus Portnoybacteria bacterium CG_4_8_14_3_um_filter_44_10]PIZ69804.1 MAG: hypothetical protein COY11_03815 [Candidatus
MKLFFNKKIVVGIILLALILLVVGLVCGWLFFSKQKELPTTETSSPNNEEQQTATTLSAATTSSTLTLKTYRNEEYGFEFQYPEDWAVEENYFVNYYSEFNLKVVPTNERHSSFPIGINIVLPEFIDKSFGGIEKTTSNIILDGVQGIKYEYNFEDRKEIAVILPMGDSRIIIGTDDSEQYMEILDQIVSSFKFLK